MSQAHVMFEGELSIFTVGELQARLLAALGEADALEVDLSQVDEIDGAGVQLLIAAKREAAALQKSLRLSGHSAAVQSMIDLADLSGFFGDPIVLQGRQP